MEPNNSQNVVNQPVNSVAPTSHLNIFSMIIVGILMLLVGFGGGYLLFQNNANKTIPSPTPTPTFVNVPSGWQLIVFPKEKPLFSFFYPENLSNDFICNNLGCFGDIKASPSANTAVLYTQTITNREDAYCDANGTITDNSKIPTDPIKIAESQASCGCMASGASGYAACTKVLNEKTIPATNNNPVIYEFYFEKNYYNSSQKIVNTLLDGPYRAYFLPKPIKQNGVEYLGIYFRLFDKAQPSLFNQILSTFKFTQ